MKKQRDTDTVILAVIRTELANRRTLLAYIKTAIGVGIASIALIHFVEGSSVSTALGLILVPVALIVLAVGIADYYVMKRKIKQERKDAGL